MTESIEVSNGTYQKILTFNERQFDCKFISGYKSIEIVEGYSVFAFVQSGTLGVDNGTFKTTLASKTYLSLHGPLKLEMNNESKILFIQIQNFLCLNLLGGPLEKTGRLRYINGCSDTLLIPPARLGDSCFNLLHFPPHTIQTEHHHPSLRFGVVVDGEGESVSGTTVKKLKGGDCFFIPAHVKHKFNTHDSAMNIIAFHPDSDWGPTDEVHPMINRTIIT